MEEKEAVSLLQLPLLITRALVIFPGINEEVEAGRNFSVQAIEKSRLDFNNLILIATQKDESQDEIDLKNVYGFGTLARIMSVSPLDGGGCRVRIIGMNRVSLYAMRFENGAFYADAEAIPSVDEDSPNNRLAANKLIDALTKNRGISIKISPASLISLAGDGKNWEEFSNVISAYLPLTVDQKIQLLKEPSVSRRIDDATAFVLLSKKSAEIDSKLDSRVRDSAEKAQRDYLLREKMKAIRQELGEDGDSADDETSIREKLEKNPYPKNVKDRVLRELKRYKMMPESSLEGSLIMSYIETLMNAPWFSKTEDNEDLNNVRKVLDEDHYGLEKVKKRIVEYLAVKKVTGNLRAPILCFYGPPGCGKTSLGRSIARALGRKFFKASLGGVSDEAEIRGHRRTYVGSMPGRIIQGMTKTGVVNPVFLLDEIDKVGGQSYHGDPSSALLEVLDPEQNFAFNDNYLEEPYDLSSVLFICTANYLENIPAPLRDRLELIEVPSYTEIEKTRIATGFLIPKQCAANGLKEEDVSFTEGAIKEIIEHYTMEAGVRQLERLIASCCRKVVVDLLDDPSKVKPVVIDETLVQKYLGIELFEGTKKEKENQIGVVTGLAYTEFGGDILPIEVTYFPGKGGLVLTGKLGDVMKESAEIALDFVRSNARKYGIPDEIFQKNDIHIHVPEGAVPKDGPSAGIAITTAIISCLSKTPVDANVAMTGEVTLRGKALPIGGLREKSLAALRCGIKRIIVPSENKKDVSELPKEVKDHLEISFMNHVDDALAIALVKKETHE